MLPVNYVAVLVAAVAVFVLGWLWYSPLLFYKPWMRLRGMDPVAAMGGVGETASTGSCHDFQAQDLVPDRRRAGRRQRRRRRARGRGLRAAPCRDARGARGGVRTMGSVPAAPFRRERAASSGGCA